MPWLLGEKTPPENWSEIQAEYADMLRTTKSQGIVHLYGRIEYTRWKINWISVSLAYLKDEYDELIAMKVAELGYDLIQPLEDREQYLRQIYLIESEAKTLIIVLNQYVNEYKISYPESDAVKHDRAHYEREMAILSKYAGYRLNDAYVTEWVGIYNLYNEENKEHA